MSERLCIQLPDGVKLIANRYDDEIFPSVDIFLEQPNGEHEKLCFVEFNTEREPGKEVCIGVYAPNEDDPVYYESYVDGGR